MKRDKVVKVRLTGTERKIFGLYAHRQGKSVAAALRAALKSEVRRHKGRNAEFSELLNLDDDEFIRSMMD